MLCSMCHGSKVYPYTVEVRPGVFGKKFGTCAACMGTGEED
jgi:hypothetical protein